MSHQLILCFTQSHFIRYFFSIFVILCSFSCNKEESSSNSPLDCSCESLTPNGNNDVWTAYLSGDTLVPAFPDVEANYWVYSFERNNPDLGIRIEGTFPNARYMSYNVYNVATGFSIGALKDSEINANCCSSNPFRGETQNTNENYKVHIIPNNAPSNDLQNVLLYDANLSHISIFLRHYLPQNGSEGGVALSNISAFDIKTGNTVDLPPTISLSGTVDTSSLEEKLTAFFKVQFDENIRFYNVDGGGFYPNLDVQYLATPLTQQEDEVYMIRFRAPTFVVHQNEIGSRDMRYWSINQSNATSQTFYGLTDENLKIAESDGFVNIVLAKDEPQNTQ